MQKISQLILLAGFGIGVGLAIGRAIATQPTPETEKITPAPEPEDRQPSPVPDPATVARYFAKVPDAARVEIAKRIKAGERHDDIAYTPATIALLSAIISRVNRRTNRAEIDYMDLMKACGIRGKSTLARHIRLLEEGLGYILVQRSAAAGKRRAVNVYRLRGMVASIVLDVRESNGLDGSISEPSESNDRTRMVSSVDGIPDESDALDMDAAPEIKIPLDDPQLDKEPIPESCTRIRMDAAVARDLIRDYGRERVETIAEWARGETWAKNPAALAVTRIKNVGWQVPAPRQPQWLPSETRSGESETDWDYNPVKPVVQDVIETQIGDYPAWRAWEIAKDQMKLQRIELWDCVMVGVEGNRVTLATNFQPVRAMRREIAAVMRSVCGCDIEIGFVGLEAVV